MMNEEENPISPEKEIYYDHIRKFGMTIMFLKYALKKLSKIKNPTQLNFEYDMLTSSVKNLVRQLKPGIQRYTK